MVAIRCDITGETLDVKTTPKGNPKLPRGWKKIGNRTISAKAWNDAYVVRAVTVPVVSPVIENASPDQLKSAWSELNERLKDAWSKSTEAANWALRQLWANDVTRHPGMTKCPKMPDIYLYGLRDWTGWSQSAGAVLRTIEKTYRSKRYEIIWVGSAANSFVRYPYPYPLHNASWELTQMDGGQIVFECRLPGDRIGMKIRTKDKGRGRMNDLKHLIANPELRGEASVFKKHDGTVMVKMVGWFPRSTRESSGTLLVRTSAAHLLTLFDEKSETLQVINGDWMRQKIEGHERYLQRWHEDMRHERRRPRRQKRKSNEDVRVRSDKQHARLKTFVDQTCASIVNAAKRKRIALVQLDDTDKGYFPSFPWFKFIERLSIVCHREGICFERLSSEKDAMTARGVVSQNKETICE